MSRSIIIDFFPFHLLNNKINKGEKKKTVNKNVEIFQHLLFNKRLN